MIDSLDRQVWGLSGFEFTPNVALSVEAEHHFGLTCPSARLVLFFFFFGIIPKRCSDFLIIIHVIDFNTSASIYHRLWMWWRHCGFRLSVKSWKVFTTQHNTSTHVSTNRVVDIVALRLFIHPLVHIWWCKISVYEHFCPSAKNRNTTLSDI